MSHTEEGGKIEPCTEVGQFCTREIKNPGDKWKQKGVINWNLGSWVQPRSMKLNCYTKIDEQPPRTPREIDRERIRAKSCGIIRQAVSEDKGGDNRLIKIQRDNMRIKCEGLNPHPVEWRNNWETDRKDWKDRVCNDDQLDIGIQKSLLGCTFTEKAREDTTIQDGKSFRDGVCLFNKNQFESPWEADKRQREAYEAHNDS